MNAYSQPDRPWQKVARFSLIFIALLLAIGLFASQPVPARADAGGFPTPTPTVTQIPTLAPTTTTAPTEALLLFPAFPTATATFEVVAPIDQGSQGQGIIGMQSSEPEAKSSGSFSLWALVPIVFVAIVIALAGIWWLTNRNQARMP